MSNDELKMLYNELTKIEKTALEYARKLLCEPTCLTRCTHPCPTHTTPKTLKNVYKIPNHNIHIRPQEHPTHLRLGIRGTHFKSSIQNIVDEVAPIKKSPPMGLRADSFKCDIIGLIQGL